MSTNYTGKFVFVEKNVGADGKVSTYDNGEYFCIRHTPGTLYCVKTGGAVYDFHAPKTFALIGSDPYTVIESWEDDSAIRQVVQRVGQEVRDVQSGLKKGNWVDYVYAGAGAAVKQVERVLDGKKGDACGGVAGPVSTTLNLKVGRHIKEIRITVE